MFWKNWKTVPNRNYNTESENPILKKDEHHAEIIDITDGLVVDEPIFTNPEYELEHREVLKKNNVWDAFGNKKL